MAQQTLDLGSIANDGTGDTLRDGGDIINDNFNELYQSLYLDVVRDFGADPTATTDSATAIQAACDAADAGGNPGSCTVFFPYGRYKLGTTITLGGATHLIGGGPDVTGNTLPRIYWTGTAGEQMFISDGFGAGTNHRGTVQNLQISGNFSAANAFELNRLDLPGGFMRNVMITDTTEHAIILQRGCTNATFEMCRFDFIEGYMIKCEDGADGTESTQNLSFVNCTVTIGTAGNSGLGQGFIWLDNEAGGSMGNTIHLNNVHIEVNDQPETWETGQGNRDACLIAVGHNATYATNTGYYQTSIYCSGVSIAFSTGHECAFIKMITSDGNPADWLEVVMVACRGSAAATFDWIDNVTTTFGADVDGVAQIPFAVFAPFGSSGPPGGEARRSYFDTRLEIGGSGDGRNLVIPVETTSPTWGQKAGMMYFNTSDSKIYVYTGSAWIATAALT